MRKEKMRSFRKESIQKVKNFPKSKNRKLILTYPFQDSYYLKSFCKILNKGIYPKLANVLFLIQRFNALSGLKILFYKIFRVKIGKNAYFGVGSFLDPYNPRWVEVGEHVLIGPDVKILTHEISRDQLKLGKVSIGNNVVIGGFTVIKAGVKIGNNVQIGMGSVVYNSLPDNCVARGNPATYELIGV